MDEEFLQAIIDTIDIRMEKRLPELLAKQKNWVPAKVATSGSGATISLYINNSTTAVEISNSRGFSLAAGQVVAVILPNNKHDNDRYIDRLL